MARYIDANKLYSRVKTHTNPYGKPTIDYDSGVKVLNMIKTEPTADVVEVKHGLWSRGTEPSGSVYAHCSSCNRKMNYSCYGYAYCSLCGARMDGTPKERGGEK